MSMYDAPALRPNIVEDLTPGSAEWTKCVTASKISGILGLSTWASPYSLWADAVGVTEPQTPDAAALKRYDRGHRLEAVLLQYLADWFRDQGKMMRVRPGATVRHPDGLDRYANPDGWVYEGRRRTPWAAVEAKTSLHATDWGEEGTAGIPAAYLAQCAWQMHITGLRVVFVPALVGLEFRVYVVQWEDVAEAIPGILERVGEWERHVRDQTPPALDGLEVTLAAVRQSHPQIDRGRAVALSAETAQALTAARNARAEAEAAEREAKARALAEAGQAQILTDPWGTPVARRQARGQGTPYLTMMK